MKKIKKHWKINLKRRIKYQNNPTKDKVRGWTYYHFKKDKCSNCGSEDNLEERNKILLETITTEPLVILEEIQ